MSGLKNGGSIWDHTDFIPEDEVLVPADTRSPLLREGLAYQLTRSAIALRTEAISLGSPESLVKLSDALEKAAEATRGGASE